MHCYHRAGSQMWCKPLYVYPENWRRPELWIGKCTVNRMQAGWRWLKSTCEKNQTLCNISILSLYLQFYSDYKLLTWRLLKSLSKEMWLSNKKGYVFLLFTNFLYISPCLTPKAELWSRFCLGAVRREKTHLPWFPVGPKLVPAASIPICCDVAHSWSHQELHILCVRNEPLQQCRGVLNAQI